METKPAVIKQLSQLLIDGNYHTTLAQTAIDGFTSDAVNKENFSLYNTRRMCSKFTYVMDMETLREKLIEKASSGANAKPVNSNIYDSVIKKLKRKNAFEGLLNYFNSEECKLADKQILINSFDKMKDNVNKETSILSPIFASIINTKINYKQLFGGDIEKTNEFEKNLEPLVCSLINSKLVDSDMTTRKLQKETSALLTEAMNLDEASVNNYFHDNATYAILNTNVGNRIEFLQVGATRNNNHRMIVVDEKGITRYFFDYHYKDENKNTRFYPDLAPSQNEINYTKLLKGDKNCIYTAFLCLEERLGLITLDHETGNTSESHVAKPENLARLLAEIVILSDKLGATENKDFAFAIANPLIDIFTGFNGDISKETFDKIIKDATLDAYEIYKNETENPVSFEEFSKKSNETDVAYETEVEKAEEKSTVEVSENNEVVENTETQNAVEEVETEIEEPAVHEMHVEVEPQTNIRPTIEKKSVPSETTTPAEYLRTKTWKQIKSMVDNIAKQQSWRGIPLTDSAMRTAIGSGFNNIKKRHLEAVSNGNTDLIQEFCNPLRKDGGLPKLAEELMVKTAKLTTEITNTVEINKLAEEKAAEILIPIMDKYTGQYQANRNEENE